MQKYKYLKTLIVLSVTFSGIWLLTFFLPYLRDYEYFCNFSEPSSFLVNLLCNDFSYESLFCTVVLTFPYTIALNYIIIPNDIEKILRFKSRNKYYINNVISVFLFSVLFVLIRTLISTIGCSVTFGADTVKAVHLYKIYLFNMIFPIMFYIKVGLLTVTANFFIARKYSPIVILLIFIAEFASLKIGIFNWVPIRDSSKLMKMVTLKITFNDYIFTLVRGVLYIALMLIISQYVYKNRDILQNEKQ